MKKRKLNRICTLYFNVVLFAHICDGLSNPNTRVWASGVTTMLSVELNAVNVYFIPP